MGSNMIKDTCLQQVDALQTRTLGPGSWCTAHFLLAQTHRKEKAHNNNKKQYTNHS